MPKPKKDQNEAPPVEVPAEAVAASQVVNIELGRLARAPENVRHTEEDADVDELKEDIRGHGVLQSLIGYTGEEEPSSNFGPFIFIVGGGRRLKALELLRDEGAVDNAYGVPVQIRPKEQAIELSLAENLARRNMSPVDEFRAFKALMDLHPATVDIANLAKRFGYTNEFVRQRMRLADLHPEILEALAEGKMTLDAAYAYASTQDLDVQLRVFRAQAKSNWQPHHASSVRAEISGKIYFEHEGVVKFVGLEAYEGEGGRYEDALFVAQGDHRRLSDTGLVDKLARAKAEAALPALTASLQDRVVALVLAPKLQMSGHSPAKPKAPNGTVWVGAQYQGVEKWKKAKKANAEVTGVAIVDSKGELALFEQGFFIPKDKKKEVDPPYNYGSSYTPPTPEEVAAAHRERGVAFIATRMAAPKAAGTAFEGRLFYQGEYVRDVQIDGLGKCKRVEMFLVVPEADWTAQREAAGAQYDEELADHARRKEEEEQVERARVAAFDQLAAQIKAGDPPAVIRLDEEPFDFFRASDGQYLDVPPAEGGDAVEGFTNLDELLDQARAMRSGITAWPTLEAFAADDTPVPGRCRICGCTENNACELDERTCDWADETHTLCDNPDCVGATAAVAIAEPEAMDEAAE